MKTAAVNNSDPAVAAKSLAQQVSIPNQAALLFFCSPEYDPQVLSSELSKVFDCPIIGCSSSGEIGTEYQAGGLVGLALPQEHFSVSTRFISPLSEYTPQQASTLTREMRAELGDDTSAENTFAFLLIDGLSNAEEQFVANTNGAMPHIPLIGGSAGDNLKFEKTFVFCNEQFANDAAVLTLVKTDLPFQTFQLKHFVPSDIEMVITKADPASRTVYEIDGGPAAEEYAQLLGMSVEDLTPNVFSAHPVMLEIGNEWYVRSIQKVNPDKSLTFYCAIDEGIPLTIGKSENFVENLRDKVEEFQKQFKEVLLTIGCDCILRKLEIEQKGIQGEVEEVLRKVNFIGFSTYGEQVDAIHVNQTLTGVVFGTR